MSPGSKIWLEIGDRLVRGRIDQMVFQVRRAFLQPSAQAQMQVQTAFAADRLDKRLIGDELRLRGDEITLETSRNEVCLDYLRCPANREEVTVDLVVPRAGQDRIDGEASVGLLGRMNVIKVLEVETDNEQMEWHVVKNAKLANLLLGDWVIDREAKVGVCSRLMSLGVLSILTM